MCDQDSTYFLNENEYDNKLIFIDFLFVTLLTSYYAL